MPGGNLQLSIKGIEDDNLTKNPEISFFRFVYNKYTHFYKSTNSISFNSDMTVPILKQTKYNIKLPKDGDADLIRDCFVKIELPKLYLNKTIYSDIKWIDNLEYNIIKSIKFSIGGRIIQEFDSEYLYTHNSLFTDKNKQNIIDNICNKNAYTNTHNTFNVYHGDNIKYTEKSILYNNFILMVPIPTWFTKEGFPIKSLKYMDIDIELILNPLNELILFRKSDTYQLNELYIHKSKYEKVNSLEEFYNIIYDKTYSYYPELVIDYIILDKLESNYFLNNSHEYLIETYNKNIIEDIKSNKINYEYETFGCTKDIIILARRKDYLLRNQRLNFTNWDTLDNQSILYGQNYILHSSIEQYNYDKKNGILKNKESIYDYLYYFINENPNDTIKLDKSVFTLLYDKLNNLYSGLNHEIILNYNNSIRSNYLYNIREKWNHKEMNDIPIINEDNREKYEKNIITDIEIKYNNMIREDKKRGHFYNRIEKYKMYKGYNNNEILVYSFSLNPDDLQPSGHCNFSHIHKVNLILNILDNTDNKYEILIYNRYYNILKLHSGVAELLYFK